jgi:hypothetical protein
MRIKGPMGSRGGRRKKKLNKKEIATVHALTKLNYTPYAIHKRTGIDNHTVAKYLATRDAYTDPKFEAMVKSICEKEIFDLVALTVEARDRLHDLAPSMNPIEAIALMDRSFQQRRLLEGKSTSNIATLAKIIAEANNDLED